jgi:hypothetical protein
MLGMMLVLLAPWQVNGALLYRSYLVKYDRGWDILCDPYIVQKDDWVYKIFRQKGEISQADFQEFLSIFKRLNPHISNIDQIRPGQNILIPLKKLEQGTLVGQASGIVTIPFVTISKVIEILDTYSKTYTVVSGDTVSRLVASRFGNYGSQSYRKGLKIFQALNPDIDNLDLIYTGQKVFLPDPEIRKQPWYLSLFDDKGDLKTDAELEATETLTAGASSTYATTGPQTEEAAIDPYAATADTLEAKLLKQGRYFFPRKGRPDVHIDLAQNPVIELQDGTRLLFAQEGALGTEELAQIQAFWPQLHVISPPEQTSNRTLLESAVNSMAQKGQIENRVSFSEQGVHVTVQAQWIKKTSAQEDPSQRYVCITMVQHPDEQTPASIRRYLDQHDIVLKEVLPGQQQSSWANPTAMTIAGEAVSLGAGDRKRAIQKLIETLGYRYAPNISITFPWAGVQITAVSNLATDGQGKEILIDFGDLYGEAVAAIEKTGFQVIQVKLDEPLGPAIQRILAAFGLAYTPNPTFWAANRPETYNTAIQIEGILINGKGERQTLVAAGALHTGIVRFLNNSGVQVVVADANQATF